MYEHGFITFGSQFNLNLQTGAFLQLILVLTGVASRLHMLCGEIGQADLEGLDGFHGKGVAGEDGLQSSRQFGKHLHLFG